MRSAIPSSSTVTVTSLLDGVLSFLSSSSLLPFPLPSFTDTSSLFSANGDLPAVLNRTKYGLLMSLYKWFHSVLPYRSEEHTSELQSLMRISYAVLCLKKKIRTEKDITT